VVASLFSQGRLVPSAAWQAHTENLPIWVGALAVQLLVVSIALASFTFLFRQMSALAMRAVESANHAEASSRLAREQAEALEVQAARLMATEQQLRDLVRALETPAVHLADGVLLVPLVGWIDHTRANALLCRLLTVASKGRIQLMILDIAGVSSADDQMAGVLLQVAEALRLLGCQVAVTGITPDVATTLVKLEARMDGMITARSPQEALALSVQAA